MIIRLTQNLNTKIKAGPISASPLDDNPYADWSARLFTADRAQYILICNTRSFYSTVMFGRGITSDHQFIERTLSSIREFMQDDGLQFIHRQFVAPTCGTVRFCKALNRRATGSMNELVATARILLVENECSPHEVGFKLNDMLLSALGSGAAHDYGKPREAFTRMS
ncbi:hypothetical protein ACERK3_08005 [Phycisphaerales bacterium AB-hyl4]|uniref:DUF6933 domain-containing protein n=1 Tax=Natronomicrosphaera hydrolytica TaxID=3242702 RepID=A0ABV4U7I6_9BACT